MTLFSLFFLNVGLIYCILPPRVREGLPSKGDSMLMLSVVTFAIMYDRLNYNKNLTPRSRELRNTSTRAEILLWQELGSSKLGYSFNRQYIIHHYIVDFYCKKFQLAVELDGPIHKYQKDLDNMRQKELETLGITVLRFSNDEVIHDRKRVVQEIKSYLTTRTKPVSL